MTKQIAIVGMHRSGTSMVARLLNLCGVYLGREDELVGPADDNPEGFWENTRFVEINERILAQLGGAWDVLPEFPENWDRLPTMIPLRVQATQIIQEWSGHEPWCWKDPRSTLTLSFWRRLLPHLKVVVCVRNPLDVVDSLSRRAYSSRLFALNLWLTYNRAVLNSTRPEERIVTHYDAYLFNPKAELERVTHLLNLPVSEELLNQASGTVEPELRHSRSTTHDLLRSAISEDVLQVYMDLCAEAGPIYEMARLAEPAPIDNSESDASFSPLRRGYIDALHLSRLEMQMGRQVQELKAQAAKNDQLVRQLSAQAAEKDQLVQQLRAQVKEKEQAVQLLNARDVEKEQVIQRLSAQTAVYEQKVVVLNAQAAKLNDQVIALQRALVLREAELVKLYTSKSWRLTAPLRRLMNAARSILNGRLVRWARSGWRWSLYRMSLEVGSDAIRDGDYFRSTGTNSQFVLRSSNERFPTGWVRLSYQINSVNNPAQVLRPRLYPNSGEGYLEQHAVPLPAAASGKVQALIKLPHQVIGLRFNPGSASAVFNLNEITIRELGKIQLGWLLVWSTLRPVLKRPRLLIGKVKRAINIVRSGGMSALKRKLLDQTDASNEFESRVSSQVTTPANDVAHHDALPWLDYFTLSQKIAEAHKSMRAGVTPKRPKLITVDEGELASYAKSLTFLSPEQPQVSIVIPVYENAKLTIECLHSILRNTSDVSYEIVVIDDGSSERTCDILSQVRNITYIRNPERLGFLRACNAAARRARGEFLLFLNNDVQVMLDWLRPLVNTFHARRHVGAVGPKILYPDGRLQEAGALINRDVSTRLIGLRDDPDLPRYNYLREVDYCSGVCLLLRTEVFHSLGGFDDNLAPAYYEDVDLCLKLRSRGLHIFYNSEPVIVHHLSATSNAVDPTYKLELVIANRQKLSEKWQPQIDDLNRVRLIAFYLPQYHTIPENDLWWGKGFTDWINVTRARPNYVGHYQPHLPSDLGFYDLRVDSVMAQQAALAKRYGIYGFCFYYYWFHGQRLLELPLERMLKAGSPNIPFCVCWANENWTRSWDGRKDFVLIAQQHSDDDDRAVIQDLMRYMRHPQYIRINGRPLLLVYRIDLFPDIRRTVEIWRAVCREEGIGELYLALVESFARAREGFCPSEYGFDASVEFPPHETSKAIPLPGERLNPNYSGIVSDYREIALTYLSRKIPGHVRFRTIMPSWDNTPRRPDDAYVFAHASPGAYQAWLEALIECTREQNFGDERIIFINAWNEWAEGTHLEPDQRFGHGYLEATRNALERSLVREN